MYSIKNLANKSLKKDLLEQFLEFANDKLAIDKPYSVYFVNDKVNASDALGKTAMYNPSTHSVYVYVTNRHPKDILRSIAHELVHHKQNCDGKLEKMSLEDAEIDANAGGYLVRQFEDGKKQLKEQQEKGFLSTAADTTFNTLTDLFGDYTGYYPEIYKNIRTLMSRGPKTLRNDKFGAERASAPGDEFRDLEVYGKYSKCLSSQEKRKDGRCYPKKFSKNKTFYDFDNLTLSDFLAVSQDAIETNKARRTSVFEGQDKTLYFSLVVLPGILNSINSVKDLPKISNNYGKIRNTVLSRIEKDLKEFSKSLSSPKVVKKFPFADLSMQRENKNLTEQSSEKFYLYNRTEIQNARRVMKLFENGIYEFGPSTAPFKTQYKVPSNIVSELKGQNNLTQKKLKDISEIYQFNASSKAAIGVETSTSLDFIHLLLDAIGLSVDPLGIGIAADLLNALLYLAKGDLINALASFAAAALFGDIAKITRGPLKKVALALADKKRYAAYWADDKVVQASIDYLVYFESKIVNKLAEFINVTSRGAKGTSVSEKYFTRVLKERLGPKLAKESDNLVKLIGTLKDYNKQLIAVRKATRKGLDPSQISKIFSNDDVLIDVLAEQILKRSKKEVARAPGSISPTIRSTADIAAARAAADKKIKALRGQLELAAPSPSALSKINKDIKAAEKAKEGLSQMADAKKVAKEILDNNPGLKEEIVNSFKTELRMTGIDIKVKEKLQDVIEVKLKEGVGLEDALKAAQKYLDENYSEIASAALKAIAGEGKTVQSLIQRNLRKIAPPSAGVTLRVGKEYLKGFGKFINDFIGKNIFGTAGIGGEVYKSLFSRVVKPLFKSLFPKPADYRKLGFVEALVKLRNRTPGYGITLIPRLLTLYLSAIPIAMIGKVSSLHIYYTRYYRHFCGDSNDFYNFVVPKLERLLRAILKPLLNPADSTSGTFNSISEFLQNPLSGIERLYLGLEEIISENIFCKRKAKTSGIIDSLQDPKLTAAINKLMNAADKSAQEEALSSFANSVAPIRSALVSNNPADINVDALVTNAKTAAANAMAGGSKGLNNVINFIDEKIKDSKTSDEDKARLSTLRSTIYPAGTDPDFNLQENNKTQNLKDNRKKLLEERLIKVSIGLIK